MIFPVGIPKELKAGERRVSLTPKGTQYLFKHNIPVYVEENAGLLSGFSNAEYEKAGGILISSAKDLWSKARLIKKVKEPVPSEFSFFSSQHIIFTYLHLASPSAKPLILALQQAKSTAIGYETIEKNGDTLLLKPMSEVAGILAAYYGAIFQTYIQIHGSEIKGIEKSKLAMLEAASKYPTVPTFGYQGKIMILGGGHVGARAAEMSAKMGGNVLITEVSDARRKQLSDYFKSQDLKIQILDPADIKSYQQSLFSADVIIGAVHSAGKRAPLVIDRELLKQISRLKQKIILDVSIDQGGNIAESKPTVYEHFLYLDSFGNVRFSVTNIPAFCGRGASIALEAASLEYTYQLTQGLEHAIQKSPELESGINLLEGKIMHAAVLEAHSL